MGMSYDKRVKGATIGKKIIFYMLNYRFVCFTSNINQYMFIVWCDDMGTTSMFNIIKFYFKTHFNFPPVFRGYNPIPRKYFSNCASTVINSALIRAILP